MAANTKVAYTLSGAAQKSITMRFFCPNLSLHLTSALLPVDGSTIKEPTSMGYFKFHRKKKPMPKVIKKKSAAAASWLAAYLLE